MLPLDLVYIAKMSERVTEAMSFLVPIEILINNTGISQRSIILETDLEVYRKLIDVNYTGHHCPYQSNPFLFRVSEKGHFVTVTSLVGKFGSPYRSGYCGVKYALYEFFDILRMEHDKDKICATLVCPGFENTNVAKNVLTGEGSPQFEKDALTNG